MAWGDGLPGSSASCVSQAVKDMGFRWDAIVCLIIAGLVRHFGSAPLSLCGSHYEKTFGEYGF